MLTIDRIRQLFQALDEELRKKGVVGEDTKFLSDYRQIRTTNDVFDIIQAYYPQRLIPPKTQFLIEELLPEQADARKKPMDGPSDTREPT